MPSVAMRELSKKPPLMAKNSGPLGSNSRSSGITDIPLLRSSVTSIASSIDNPYIKMMTDSTKRKSSTESSHSNEFENQAYMSKE